MEQEGKQEMNEVLIELRQRGLFFRAAHLQKVLYGP